MKLNVTGIILAGGKSSRIGCDKSFLEFSGKTLLEIIISKLNFLCRYLIVVVKKKKPYLRYGITVVEDKQKEYNPLLGIYSGLMHSKTKYNIIVACDMPFLNHKLLKYLLSQKKGYDIVVPFYQSRYQVLSAVYAKSCVQAVEELLKQGTNFKISKIFEKLKVRKILPEEIAKFDPEGFSFFNINTLKDYSRAKTFFQTWEKFNKIKL